MPRHQLTKDEFRIRILKLRKKLDDGLLGDNWSGAQKHSARCVINQILDVIDEYRY